MAHGGRRTGAGRPPGSFKAREVRKLCKELNYDPLKDLITQAQETEDAGVKRDIAKAILPYTYPKLSAVELSNDEERPQRPQSLEEIVQKI